MSQALYRKWRPKTWDEVVGQPHITQTLRNAIAGDRVAHAYLFSGPRGTGKTSVARLLAKAVNCLAQDLADRPCNQCEHCCAVNEGRFLDLIEIDAASNTSVDDVRDLREKINFTPNQGRFKVYIVDEVHMLSTAAFNALLKTLEEPPPHAIFILATTEIHKIPATVLSRCQRHEFRRLPADDITAHLNQIVKTEGISAEPEALTLIAHQATGSLRDAISLLDQLASTGKEITLEFAHSVLGTAASQAVFDLVDAMVGKASREGLDAIHHAIDSGTDARVLARQVVDYLRVLLMVKLGNEARVELPADAKPHVKRHASALSAPEILRMIRAFNAAAVDLRSGWQPSLPLELALAETLETTAAAEKAPAVQKAGSERVKPVKPEAATPQPSPKSSAEAKAKSETAGKDQTALALEQVAQAWKQIRANIKPNNPTLAGLLNSCKLLVLKDGVLTLGFASDVLRSKMDKPEQLKATCKAIEQVLGVEIKIRCVVTNARQSAPPDVKDSGMVATALQAGGEIVDIQE